MYRLEKGLPVVALGIGLLLMGCSANVRVMPGNEDVNRAIAHGVEQAQAENKAVDEAIAYCADRGQQAVFLDEESEYTGDLDEQEREAIRRGANAAVVAAGVLRTTNARDAAVVFDGVSGVGWAVTSGRDYRAEVRFTCR